MISYIVRHGQTNYSKRYLVNGDPAKPIQLNDEGRQSLSRAWATLPLHAVATWLASEFPRAQQTAFLLMGVPAAELVVDARLNELDYGKFESSPFLEYAVWLDSQGASRRPPGATESQSEGIRRMLSGVFAALEHPGPRVLVGHGLLVSVLLWHQGRSANDRMPLFFPEAPYVEPVAIPDDELPILITTLLDDLDASAHQEPAGDGGGTILRISGGSTVATVDSASPSRSLDKKDLPHA
ncbi:histidine phosphatase family protein [Streptomyces sp. H10-C2]|uniref:histidine phosphatase family protein n=1 Tax=unclassified Streptomyces TaxID=2593676 RepID=UPI0024BB005A|nr:MULTISPECIES: histidine phosphatase family protein [unclassified Streptomyces]MDJ0342629.1 histidine phosphatase family protein [Streptomyces sp. PH10-H1]MDJ0368517.1 histidine phosphatase family protein [Streptomyces sp. H10-C2]